MYSSLFVRLWLHTWRLWCPYLFLIIPSFGASEGLCFVFVAFPEYLNLYFSFIFLFYNNIQGMVD